MGPYHIKSKVTKIRNLLIQESIDLNSNLIVCTGLETTTVIPCHATNKLIFCICMIGVYQHCVSNLARPHFLQQHITHCTHPTASFNMAHRKKTNDYDSATYATLFFVLASPAFLSFFPIRSFFILASSGVSLSLPLSLAMRATSLSSSGDLAPHTLRTLRKANLADA